MSKKIEFKVTRVILKCSKCGAEHAYKLAGAHYESGSLTVTRYCSKCGTGTKIQVQLSAVKEAEDAEN